MNTPGEIRRHSRNAVLAISVAGLVCACLAWRFGPAEVGGVGLALAWSLANALWTNNRIAVWISGEKDVLGTRLLGLSVVRMFAFFGGLIVSSVVPWASPVGFGLGFIVMFFIAVVFEVKIVSQWNSERDRLDRGDTSA